MKNSFSKKGRLVCICNSAEEIAEQVQEPTGEWVEPIGEGERAQITRLPGLSYTVYSILGAVKIGGP